MGRNWKGLGKLQDARLLKRMISKEQANELKEKLQREALSPGDKNKLAEFDAHTDMAKPFAELLTNVHVELMQNRGQQYNQMHAYKRLASLTAKAAQEGIELQTKIAGLVEGLGAFVSEQSRTNQEAQRTADILNNKMVKLNSWMLRAAIAAGILALASLVIAVLAWRHPVEPAPKSQSVESVTHQTPKSKPKESLQDAIAPSIPKKAQ